MSTSIDGFDVFRRLAGAPGCFSNITPSIHKVARDLVVKHLKEKTTDLIRLRDTWKALGTDNLSLILDTLKDTEIKTLVTRFDRYHPDLKTSTVQWRRAHLSQLAYCAAEPAQKPAPKGGKKARSKKNSEAPSPTQALLESKAMAAVRKRRRT